MTNNWGECKYFHVLPRIFSSRSLAERLEGGWIGDEISTEWFLASVQFKLHWREELLLKEFLLKGGTSALKLREIFEAVLAGNTSSRRVPSKEQIIPRNYFYRNSFKKEAIRKKVPEIPRAIWSKMQSRRSLWSRRLCDWSPINKECCRTASIGDLLLSTRSVISDGDWSVVWSFEPIFDGKQNV